MRIKVPAGKILAIAAAAALVLQVAGAQSAPAKEGGGENMPERLKVIRAAADALGMLRWSDIGAGPVRLPAVDVITTMEFQATGTMDSNGQSYKTDYHETLDYNPPALRVETTRTDGSGSSQHMLEVANGKYAWDESELGAGLVPGKGTATPEMKSAKERMLQLWILPYGVVKSAFWAGDQTKVSMDNGMRVLTFPLSGDLAGVTVMATLDAKGLVTKVETKSSDPALTFEVEYSDYADHGEIPTDVKSPGHIVEKRGGKPFLDLQIKTWDGNNPYLVFPVPESVKAAATS